MKNPYEDEDDLLAESIPKKSKVNLPETKSPDEFNIGVSIQLLESRLRVLESKRIRICRAIEGHTQAIEGLKKILNNPE